MTLLLNIDVPDLAQARAFYAAAFGWRDGRRLGPEVQEMLGAPVPVYLLHKPPASDAVPQGGIARTYERHWCPLHFDVVVDDIEAASARVLAAGARQERAVQSFNWGRLGLYADPFGHGFCLVQFLGRGYDEIAD